MSLPNTPSGSIIHALVIGPGGVGAAVVDQLAKNRRFNITWIGKEIKDSEHYDKAKDDVIKIIDLEKVATPLTINDLIEENNPDIVFLCQRGKDHDKDLIAGTNLERELLGESALIGDAPVITVSLEQDTSL